MITSCLSALLTSGVSPSRLLHISWYGAYCPRFSEANRARPAPGNLARQAARLHWHQPRHMPVWMTQCKAAAMHCGAMQATPWQSIWGRLEQRKPTKPLTSTCMNACFEQEESNVSPDMGLLHWQIQLAILMLQEHVVQDSACNPVDPRLMRALTKVHLHHANAIRRCCATPSEMLAILVMVWSCPDPMLWRCSPSNCCCRPCQLCCVLKVSHTFCNCLTLTVGLSAWCIVGSNVRT